MMPKHILGSSKARLMKENDTVKLKSKLGIRAPSV